MRRCKTCAHYRPPIRARQGLCLVYEERNAGPRVMPSFGCEKHAEGAPVVDAAQVKRLLSWLSSDLHKANVALASAAKHARKLRAIDQFRGAEGREEE